MLDVKFIRENKELVEKSAKEKGYKINIQEVLDLDEKRRGELVKVEELRRKRNEIAAKMKGGKPSEELIKEGKAVKDELAGLEADLEKVEVEYKAALKAVPNIIFEDVPLGGEECSVEVKSWGGKKKEGVDHLDYATSRDWVDFERGAKVTVPDLVSSKVLEGTGFNPRTSDQSDEYFIEGEDLALIATAEIALTGYHMDEIIDEKDLPLKYAGLSACFRKEAGSAGKHTRGLFRVHQFNKLEMYIFCLPEKSKEMHEEILAIEEEIWQELGIPYRVINIAAGDLGAPAAKKYDVEYWSPVDQTYRELTSCSNCTDFQARNLNIRVRRADGTVEVLHTLNGTAVSLARTMVAVMENYATEGGKLKVPEVLKPYLGGKDEI